MSDFTVGGDVEAWCTACKMMREHVVVALVGKRPAKVECVHCHGQHRYRVNPPGTRAAKAKAKSTTVKRTRKKAEPEPVMPDLQALVADKTPRPYSLKEKFEAGEVVGHPKFGVGYVLEVTGPQKMEVLFEGGAKLLLHDRGAVSAPTLQRPSQRNDAGSSRVSDAPPVGTEAVPTGDAPARTARPNPPQRRGPGDLDYNGI